MNASDLQAAAAISAVLVAGENALAHAIALAMTGAGIRVVTDYVAVDSVVCCVVARPGVKQLLADLDEAVFRTGIQNSLEATFRVSRKALPHLLARKGSLVYCVAGDDDICVQAVQTLMRGIVYQYGPQGVRANLVKAGTDVKAAAALVRFLVSGDASFMNGATL
jgi:hypothetical protein